MKKNTSDLSQTQRALNIWAIVLILWSVYRSIFKTDLPVWFDEFIAKPAIFLIQNYYFITRYENGNVLKRLDISFKNALGDISIATLVGVLMFGFAALISSSQGHNIIWPSIGVLVFTIIVSLASSISEELLARGFILKRLYEESHNVISAVFVASILFFLTHIPIVFSSPQYYGASLIMIMVSDLLFSFAVSFIYLLRKNVLVPIVIHLFYILIIYILFSPLG